MKIVIGDDGLPHCLDCKGDDKLCFEHQTLVKKAVGELDTSFREESRIKRFTPRHTNKRDE